MKSPILKISEIEFIPVKPKKGLIGFASFVLDEKYYVSSVAIYTRLDGSGYRLVYPTKKVGEKNINIFHPINREVAEAIEEAVTKKVNELFNNSFNEQYVS
jgi:DNA-binding cell septation regulator SpoVG